MDKKNVKKEYSNGEITIVWESAKCIHSTRCWNEKVGLKSVFNPQERPWIKPEGASSDDIMRHIQNCPSGALSYYRNNENNSVLPEVAQQIVEVVANGPLMVFGNIEVKCNNTQERKSSVTAFCRCGHSSNKPYCDGAHVKNGFQG